MHYYSAIYSLIKKGLETTTAAIVEIDEMCYRLKIIEFGRLMIVIEEKILIENVVIVMTKLFSIRKNGLTIGISA